MEDTPRKSNCHAESSNAADAACSDTAEDVEMCPHPELLSVPSEPCQAYVIAVNGSTNSMAMRFFGEDYSDQLDLYEELLQTEFTKEQLQPITTGMMCVVNYKDRFSRVHIMSIEDGKVTCFFPDHGEIESLTLKDIRPLDPVVNKKLPYQVIKVSLHGLEHIAENPIALSILHDWTDGVFCVAKPTFWNRYSRVPVLSVVLYDSTGEFNINKAIRTGCRQMLSDISSRGL